MSDAGRQDRTTPLTVPDAEAARSLLARARTLIIASTDAAGEPLASYAPFLARDEALHVFVSRLAAHHANLALARGVSVMIIEDEARSPQPFARERVTLRCRVHGMARDDARHASLLDAMQARFGATVATLRELPDFELFRLVPEGGLFVQGFGKAHRLSAREARALIGISA